MADHTTPTEGVTESRRSSWRTKAVAALVGVVVLVVTYLILAAAAPRWWSIRVGDLAGQTFHRGILWGLVFGLVSTFVPLLLVYAAFAGRRTRARRWIAVGAGLLALVVAAPNLLTLAIVAGNGNAAHAGERTLDTEAPGFRGATLVGVVVAVALFAFVTFLLVRARRRRALKKATRDAARSG